MGVPRQLQAKVIGPIDRELAWLPLQPTRHEGLRKADKADPRLLTHGELARKRASDGAGTRRSDPG